MELETAHPDEILPESPTHRVGGVVLKVLPNTSTSIPFIVLQDAFSREELEAFDQRVRKEFPSISYVCELKIDGLSISLTYENGVPVTGATRGMVLSVRILQRTSSGSRTFLCVTRASEHYSSRRSAICHGLPLIGSIRSVKKTASRSLLIHEMLLQERFANWIRKSWHAEISQPSCIKKWVRRIKAVRKACWEISPLRLCREPRASAGWGYGANLGLHPKVAQLREDLPYDIDGIVIKVNDLAVQEELGFTVKL